MRLFLCVLFFSAACGAAVSAPLKSPQIEDMGQRCRPGDVAFEECNQCTCDPNRDGADGHWGPCTRKACDESDDYSKVPRYIAATPICNCQDVCDCEPDNQSVDDAKVICEKQGVDCACEPCPIP